MPQTFATIAAASHRHVRHTEPKPRAKLAPDQVKERREDAAARQQVIDEALAKWWSDSMALADDLATRYKMKANRKLTRTTCFKAEKAAECRANGESKNVRELHEEFFEEYSKLTDEEKDALVERHKDVGSREVKLRRDTPRAKIQDVSNMVRNMQLLMMGLNQRVGIEGFFCIVRNSSDFHMQPHLHFSSRHLEEYMTIAARQRWNTAEVGAKLEAFAIAGCDVVNLLRTSKQKADHLKMSIRDIVRDKLITKTGDRNAQMQYTNYEEGIVHRYGVKLVGWTFEGPFISPSEMSTSLPALQKLYDALKDDSCRFEKLSPVQLAERIAVHRADIAAGAVAPRVRQPRSDIGTKRPRPTNNVDEEGDSANNTDRGTDNPAQPAVPEAAPPAKRRRKAVAAPREHDDEEEEQPLQETAPKKTTPATAKKSAPAVAKKGAKKTTRAPRDDATTRAALQRIKSRPFITSDDERDKDPDADKENDAGAVGSGGTGTGGAGTGGVGPDAM
ncbi:hypothetical protein DFH09DRAFT_1347256 [Mycena vulgaris]|nr:hypothetical protein DFH09DRAFT_1347256 [Mycena vulgaris]